jgi:hypothetical protein
MAGQPLTKDTFSLAAGSFFAYKWMETGMSTAVTAAHTAPPMYAFRACE